MFKIKKGTKEKYLKLRSVATAVDRDGGTYEMEREGNDWKVIKRYGSGVSKTILKDIEDNNYSPGYARHLEELARVPDYYLSDTVVEWYDELHNYDLIRLAIWCYENEIYLPYNFR